MKAVTQLLVLSLVLSFAVLPSYSIAKQEGEKNTKTLVKTLVNDQWDFISVNNILMWISNNGRTAHNPKTSASGLEWPKGSAKYAIFTDGLVWGGRIQGQIRVGGATYVAGLQAGHINPDGSASDPSDPRHRIYKITKMDSLSYTELDPKEQDRLMKDFLEWPTDLGAPWTDKNMNGVYEPDFDDWLVNGNDCTSDTPFMIGDEIIWFVSNDLDSRRTRDLYGSPPIGLELHTFVWAYKQTGPLSNMIFTKYTLINKGIDDLEDAYLSKWSDPDLGDAFDDYVGIDTTLSLGYVYNGLAKDEVYGTPPASGYDFFQGPVVPSPGDVAHYNFGLRDQYKNLPVSTFAFYINSSGVYRDPALKDPAGAEQMYNYMEGYLWNRRAYIDPTTGQTVKVCLAGDPITKKGWIDGIVSAPGDRRFLMTAGPFKLAKGDSQEVVVATIVAQGADRLTSIKVLKYYDKFAQLAFDNNFDLPKAPPSPTVKASLQPNKIILTWGDPESVARTEKHNDRGYKFQGYNVYQFPKKSSTLADGIRLATYDIPDDVSMIFDEVIDEKSGVVLDMPVQFGPNESIQRMYEITKDVLIDRPLVNNQPYYFAVTAYAYNEDPLAVPRQLESAPVIIEAKPQMTDPGVRYGEPLKNKITPNHPSGSSTGIIDIVVVDPIRLTGDTYEVIFTSTGEVEIPYDHDLNGSVDTLMHSGNYNAWSLFNVTKGRTVIDRDTTMFGLTKNYFIVDGYQIGLTGSGYYNQYKLDLKNPNKLRLYHNEILKREWSGGPEVYFPYGDSAGWWEMGYVAEGFGSKLKGFQVNKIVEVRLDTVNPSKGYLYTRGMNPNYAFRGYYNSPVSVWDVSDPKNPRQISWAFVEQYGRTANDSIWAPTTDAANDREYFFVIDEDYSDTPNPQWSDLSFRFNTMAKNMPILYWAHLQIKTEYANSVGTRFGKKIYPWKNGSKWKITPNVPFSADDKYVFSTLKAKPKFDMAVAREDIAKINVFPNPYFGSNAKEQNKYQRFVTFNHLPDKAYFRIYTVSGTLVRSFSKKEDGTQYATWDLNNENGLPVGSGLYYIHIEMPELGVEKILRLAIIAETQFLDRI